MFRTPNHLYIRLGLEIYWRIKLILRLLLRQIYFLFCRSNKSHKLYIFCTLLLVDLICLRRYC